MNKVKAKRFKHPSLGEMSSGMCGRKTRILQKSQKSYGIQSFSRATLFSHVFVSER